MMIEQNIETAVAAKIESALSSLGDNIKLQTVCQLSPSVEKQTEDPDTNVFVIVKAQPRSYSTATIPTCEVPVTVTALVRADVDYQGQLNFDVLSKLLDVYEHWQKCYDDTHDEFSISEKFNCTGYRLDTGTFSTLQADKVWQYDHSMTVLGVVQ